MADETPQEEWRRKTYEHSAAINEYVARGLKLGWDRAGKQPEPPVLTHLTETALAAIRLANQTGDLENLRRDWPPSYDGVHPVLDAKGQSLPVACALDDGSVVVRVGAPYLPGRTVRIVGNEVVDVPHVGYFGRSPNRDYFAVAGPHGVRILRGWGGPQVKLCPWPTGLEGLPEKYRVAPLAGPPHPEQLIPFPDGQRVLLVSNAGVFVLAESGARRLLPTPEWFTDVFGADGEHLPGDPLSGVADMAHGAISRDGRLIAVGSQDTAHLVFDAGLNLIAEIGNRSEYPHYALFSADDSVLAFNSCHFYSGVTIGVRTDVLPGLVTTAYEPDDRVPTLEGGARVYAGVARGDELIVGDAFGYLRAFSTTGEYRWQHFIGSTIGAIELSRDGRTLVVTTFGGFVSIIALDAGEQQPYQIGNGDHLETRRWLLWRGEPKALIW